MKYGAVLICGVLAALTGCQPTLPLGERNDAVDAAVTSDAAAEETQVIRAGERIEFPAPAPLSPAAAAELAAVARRPGAEETICHAFSRRIAEAALRHPDDTQAFLSEIQEEFVGGTDDPFELKAGLRAGRWNQRYFYAGHGGFLPQYDDAQRYARTGGNHQPGHFISVLSIAARFGEEQGRLAIAYAGDYDPGDEDDLRLSNIAIPLGAGLRDGSVTPAGIAVRARELCR
ncbi:MAG: hypothetical protein H0X65_11705 [Gemmatimonadetes bacterium]|nr:hypothetical protein [Gemmatimonadota bacterium]